VIIVSDAGMRGEASDERLANGVGWGKDRDGVVDIRTVLSRDLLGGPYVTQIRYEHLAELPVPFDNLSDLVLIQLHLLSF
jgi:cell cycle checkpoint protein